MRKRVQQPVIRVSKIEDTPLGREYQDELLSGMAAVTGSIGNGLVTSSNTTSPTSVNILDLSSGTGLTPSSYPPSEMDASIAGSEHLTNEELVNCTCRRVEEDGLMIQCDICLCWQHGYCAGIEDEDPVPEKHVCETCRQPAGGRTEAKFSLDQDWLKEGKLPSADAIIDPNHVVVAKRKSSSAIFDRETAFRKLSELMADLANLDKVLHCLRVKLHVASQPSNSKVFMWSSVWSVATHQPMSIDEEEEVEREELQAGLEPDHDHLEDRLQPSSSMHRCKEMHNPATANAAAASAASSAMHRQSAIDPHAVAEKLNLLASANKSQQKEEEAASDYKIVDTPPLMEQQPPKVNGISRDRELSPIPNVVGEPESIAEKEQHNVKVDVPSANDHAFRSSNNTNTTTTAELTSQKVDASSNQVPVVAKVTTTSSASSSSGSTPPPLPLSSSSPSFSSTPVTMAMSLHAQQGRGLNLNAATNHVNAECETKLKTEEALTNGSTATDETLTSAAEGNGKDSAKDKVEADMVDKKFGNPNDAIPVVVPAAAHPVATPDHFDTSFVPSVSELERLLPSVIEEIQSVKNAAAGTTSTSSSHNSTSVSGSGMMGGTSVSATVAASSSSSRVALASTSGFIPEPKRLDRDECRLNLLQHIESVQEEVENRYSAIESAISKIEAMPGASNAGFSLAQISGSDAKMKAKLNKLIQDLSVARQLMWTL